MSNREIGSELFITPKTASVHVSNILAKLGAASRTEAAAIAYREGALPQPRAGYCIAAFCPTPPAQASPSSKLESARPEPQSPLCRLPPLSLR
jgi:hypothetical protein